MATAIGDVAVRVGANIEDLKQGMAEGSRTVGQFASKSATHLRRTVNDLAKVGAAAAAVAAGGLAAITKQATETGRELQQMSRLANASTSEFQRMAFGANALGIQNDKLADILKDVNDRIGDFIQTGGGPMADFFENIAPKVGVTAQQFARLSGPQALQLFYTSLEKANLSQADMTFYLEAMASDLTALQPLLRNNGQLLKEQGDRAERLGIILSEVELQQLDAGAESFREMAATIKMVGTMIGASLVPYIQAIGESFGGAVEGAGGFRAMVESVVNTSIRGFGKVGNVIHGLRVALKGVEVAAVGFGAAAVSAFQLIAEGITIVNDDINRFINWIIAGLNKITGTKIGALGMFTESDFMKDLREMGNAARDKVGEVRGELHALAMEDLPSDNIEKFLADVAQKSKEAAEAVVSSRNSMVTMPEDQMGGGFDNKAEQEKQEAALEAIKARYLTEQELLREHREQMAIIGEEYDAARFETEEEWRSIKEQAEADHMDRLAKIRQDGMSRIEKFQSMSMANQLKTVTGALVSMTNGVASENKKMFEINKKAAIASAIISAYQGISTTLGTYPFPLSVAMAAVQAAAAFAQVSAIRSQSFGGGGGVAPSLAGGTPAPPTTPVGGAQGQGGGQQVMRVEGLDIDSLFSGDAIKTIAGGLLDFQKDGGQVVFA